MGYLHVLGLSLIAFIKSCNLSPGPTGGTPSQEEVYNLNVQPTASHVAAGYEFLCGIQEADKTTLCRGETITEYRDESAQKSKPSPDYEQAKSIPAKAIACGSENACIIREDNEQLYCFGTIRIQHAEQRMSTLAIPSDRILDVAVGADHVCVILKADNKIKCFGDNESGQLENIPQGPARSIAAGHFHTCAISYENQAKCWGENYSGQANPPKIQLKALSLAQDYSCGITHDDKPICWGKSSLIANMPHDLQVLKMASKQSHTCVIKKSDNQVVCFGHTSEGSESFADAAVPSTLFRDIAVGRFFNCGVKADGQLQCWGDEVQGPLMNSFNIVIFL